MADNKNLIKIFEYALNQEETGKSFFESSMERMGIGAAISAFKKLVEEERRHIEFITQILRDLKAGTVFNTAWLIEKDLSEFYARMAEKTEGKAKEALTMLSNWEKQHEQFFRDYRDKLSETYAKMPWGG